MNTLLFRGFSRVERRIRSLWIHCHAACFGQLRVVIRPIPIATPFPNVARHVVEAVAICRELSHRRKASITVLTAILDREFPLPGIGHPFPVRPELIAPGIGFT